MPSLLINNEKVKDPEMKWIFHFISQDSEKVADVFNSFFLTIAESLNLHQVGKEDSISFLKFKLALKRYLNTHTLLLLCW
jgi:hypothetical protein